MNKNAELNVSERSLLSLAGVLIAKFSLMHWSYGPGSSSAYTNNKILRTTYVSPSLRVARMRWSYIAHFADHTYMSFSYYCIHVADAGVIHLPTTITPFHALTITFS